MISVFVFSLVLPVCFFFDVLWLFGIGFGTVLMLFMGPLGPVAFWLRGGRGLQHIQPGKE